MERPPFEMNRDVKGMRAFNTAYISTVEGKLNRQAKASATAKRDDSRLVLHLDGNLAREMGEARDFREKLPRMSVTMKKGTVKPWHVLEGNVEQKNIYLQQLMENVNSPSEEVLEWGNAMGLYSHEAA